MADRGVGTGGWGGRDMDLELRRFRCLSPLSQRLTSTGEGCLVLCLDLGFFTHKRREIVYL